MLSVFGTVIGFTHACEGVMKSFKSVNLKPPDKLIIKFDYIYYKFPN